VTGIQWFSVSSQAADAGSGGQWWDTAYSGSPVDSQPPLC